MEADPKSLYERIFKLGPSPAPFNRTGIGIIAYERNRQILVEGFTPEKDRVGYQKNELLKAALCYVACSCLPLASMKQLMKWWPWDKSWWKPSFDVTRNLAKAGALIAAHLDMVLATTAQGSPLPSALPSKEVPVHLPRLAMDICEQNLHIVVGRAVEAHAEAMIAFEKAQNNLERARTMTKDAYELMVFLKSCGSPEAALQFDKLRHQLSHLTCDGVPKVGVSDPLPHNPKPKQKGPNYEEETDKAK